MDPLRVEGAGSLRVGEFGSLRVIESWLRVEGAA